MKIAGFIIACVLIGYLFGSISFSVIIGNKVYHKDLRDYESKNAGATNAARVFGKKTGLIVLILDMLKCIIPTLIIWGVTKGIDDPFGETWKHFDPLTLTYICPLFVIIGHCYPLFFHFKGGKGAACFAALIMMVSPIIALIAGVFFLAVTKKFKMVSLSVLLTSTLCLFMIFIPGLNFFCLLQYAQSGDWTLKAYDPYYSSLIFIFFIVFLSLLLLVYKHRENIERLRNNTERKIGEKKEVVETQVVSSNAPDTSFETYTGEVDIPEPVDIVRDIKTDITKEETLTPDDILSDEE